MLKMFVKRNYKQDLNDNLVQERLVEILNIVKEKNVSENILENDKEKDLKVKRSGIIGEMLFAEKIGGKVSEDIFADFDVEKDGKCFDIKVLNIESDIQLSKEEVIKSLFFKSFYIQEKQIQKYKNDGIIPVFCFLNNNDALFIYNDGIDIGWIKDNCLLIDESPYNTSKTHQHIPNYIIPYSIVFGKK